MRKIALFSVFFWILLSGCAPAAGGGEDTFTVAATTWPVYCLASALAEGAEGVEVVPVINQPMSCLHDYTLTIADMKALERADLILMNGAGFEDFMDAALSACRTPAADCSAGIALLYAGEHEPDHDHSHDHGAYDPHIWLDPLRYADMADNAARILAEADPANGERYAANAVTVRGELTQLWETGMETLAPLKNRGLIPFHDGFSYLADSFDLEILMAIEEEEGSETSAREFKELMALIKARGIPAVFTEVNGSDATAKALRRETGVAVAQLSMVMSGEGTGLEPYLTAMRININTLAEALT